MALGTDQSLQLDYDARGDVLYASIGEPQPALSVEIDTDILLNYVPTSPQVVGITILYFLKHFPNVQAQPFQAHAITVVEGLLQKYPAAPLQ